MTNKVKKGKVVNYTPEMTAEMLAAYTLEPTKETVEALATKVGKTTRSIVAKLSREGVYRKAEYVGKSGDKPVNLPPGASRDGVPIQPSA